MAKETPVALALRAAVDKVGSQSAMGRLLGVSQAAVWAWLKEGKALPAEHVLTVEAATGVSRYDLRPDLYPREEVTHVPVIGRLGVADSCDRSAGLQVGEPAR